MLDGASFTVTGWKSCRNTHMTHILSFLFILYFNVAQLTSMALFCLIHHLYQPDRNKQSGAVNRRHNSGRDVPYNPRRDLEAAGKDLNPRQKDVTPAVDTEQRAPVGKFPMDYIPFRGQLTEKTVPGSETREEKSVLSLGHVDEDYHRDFSNMLGDVTVLR